MSASMDWGGQICYSVRVCLSDCLDQLLTGHLVEGSITRALGNG